MQLMVYLFYPVIFFVFLVWCFSRQLLTKKIGINKFVLPFFLFIHVLCGIGLSAIYTYYYPNRNLADTFKYFDDSKHLFALFHNDNKVFWKIFLGLEELGEDVVKELSFTNNWFPNSRRTFFNDNRTVIRMNTLLRFISFGNYYIHLLFFIVMGFVGKIFIYQTLKKYIPTTHHILWLFTVFLIPSVVFWTSGVLKEGPLFLLLGLIVYYLDKVYCSPKKTHNYLILLLLAYLMVFIKFYVVLFMIPAILWVIQVQLTQINKWKLLIFNAIFYILIIQIWHWIHPRWSLLTILHAKKNDFEGLAQLEAANSYIQTYALDKNIVSFILNIPQGLFHALFQPLLWKCNTIFMWIAFFENTILLIFVLFLLFYSKQKQNTSHGIFALWYALCFLIITGMITPIAGSLVRYKIPALSFLLFYCIQKFDFNKISSQQQNLIQKFSKLFFV
jgi:hypothetical protein